MWCMPMTSPHGSPLSTTADKLYLTRSTRDNSDTPIRLIGPTALISEMEDYFVTAPPDMQRCITGNSASTTGEGLAGSPAPTDIAGSRGSGRRLGWLTRPKSEPAADPDGGEDGRNIAEQDRQESWHIQARNQKARPGIAVMPDRDSESHVLRASECKPLILAAEERRDEEQEGTQNAASQKYILFTFSS